MIIDGKKVAETILNDVKKRHDILKEKMNRAANLTVILVGDNEASKIYVKNKQKACEKVGINSSTIILDKDVSKEKLIDTIKNLNDDSTVDGILLQLPLPKSFDQVEICSYIDTKKDVDGFTPKNIGKLMLNKNTIIPCTALGVIKLLEYYNIPIESSDVLIIGRSNIVGKPLMNLLLNKSATVQICHSKTKDIDDKISRADIIICAAGYPKLINEKHKLKKGVVLIDVGINRVDNKICGDIDFHNVVNKKENEIGYITPVPGGVGPMTIACLLENVLNSFEGKCNSESI